MGRKTAQPWRTAVGGFRVDNQFKMVSEHSAYSDDIYNGKGLNTAVRMRIGG